MRGYYETGRAFEQTKLNDRIAEEVRKQALMVQAAAQKLIYFRCLDCLSTMTAYQVPTVCACGGKIERMGVVHGNNYLRTEERCACDERCTCARGPKCDCSCGGKNHGTGAMVEVVVEEGVVKVKVVDEKALARKHEFALLLAGVVSLYNAKKSANATVKDEKACYHPMWMIERDISRAARLKVHGLRMKRLQAIKAMLEAA